MRANELCLNTTYEAPAEQSDNILDRVPHDAIKSARRRNFLHLHDALSDINLIDLPPLPSGSVPFAYPLLPCVPVSHEELHAARIWVPRLWPERTADREATAWTRRLSSDLL